MALIPPWLTRRPAAQPAGPVCAQCRHFVNDARALEQALPGMTVFSSGDAAVRDQDGLCLRHQRLTSPRSACREPEI
jgi:hypothetical protein